MIILGIDVSKAKLNCYLSQGIEQKAHSSLLFQVLNNEDGFKQICKFLQRKGFHLDLVRVVLEPTSTYHLELTYWLAEQGVSVCLANPGDVRFFARSLSIYSKNDGLDCFVLAQFGQTRELHCWQPPAENMLKLSQLMRVRRQIIKSRIEAENRLSERSSRLHGIGETYLHDTVAQFKAQEKAIDTEIRDLIKDDESLYKKCKNLLTIPGVGKVTAALLIVLFNTHSFTKGEQVAAFCGLVPKEYQSGTSVLGKSRLTKRGSGEIRGVLRMGATAVLATLKNSHLKSFYQRMINAGKPKSSALGALMHKLLLVAFAIWRDDTTYNYGAMIAP